MAFRYLRLKSG